MAVAEAAETVLAAAAAERLAAICVQGCLSSTNIRCHCKSRAAYPPASLLSLCPGPLAGLQLHNQSLHLLLQLRYLALLALQRD